DRTGERVAEAELWRLCGDSSLATSGDAGDVAESALVRAVEIARMQSAKSWELRAALSLAKLSQGQQRDDRRGSLQCIVEWFTEGTDTPDYVAAQTFLLSDAR